MTAADGSAYAVLGLQPDADPAEIERAYKRLIKQHHPDRKGGNAARAAEINHAYRQLCAERHLRASLELNDDGSPQGPSGRAWLTLALLLSVAIGFLALAKPPMARMGEGIAPGSGKHSPNHPNSSRQRTDPMDQPLHLAEIDGAVASATRLARSSDEMGFANFSRDCHHALRTSPSFAQFDRCAAFDDAVVQLQDRDPLRDQGPFGELAVTGRAWSGASGLSDDSVAIDGRLDRIRLRVEIALAPQPVPSNATDRD